MKVGKTSRRAQTIRKEGPLDQDAAQGGLRAGKRKIIKIVPEPQPTPEGRQVPKNEVIPRRKRKR